MAKYNRAFASYADYIEFRIRALIANYHNDKAREKWDANYNRELEPIAAHQLVCGWIEQYQVPFNDRYLLYHRAMTRFLQSPQMEPKDLLKRFVDGRTQAWFQEYEETFNKTISNLGKPKEKEQRRSPEEIIEEAIKQVKAYRLR